MSATEQEQVRNTLIRRLRLDLLGPSAPDEVLTQNRETREGDNPLSRYLIGILYPANSIIDPDEDDFSNDGGDDEEDDTPEAPIQITGMPKPSSIGLSFAITEGAEAIQVEFRYGLYQPTEVAAQQPDKPTSEAESKQKTSVLWQRVQVAEIVTVTLPTPSAAAITMTGGGRGECIECDDNARF